MTKKKNIILNEGLSAASRIASSIIPAGNLLTEFFEFGNKVKSARAQEFMVSFYNALKNKLGREIPMEEFQREDFIDAFNIIIKCVANTKSEEKLRRFKSILMNEYIKSSDDHLFQLYLNYLSEINEVQIKILEKLSGSSNVGFRKSIEEIADIFDTPENNATYPKPTTVELDFGGSINKIERSDFYILTADLVTKGLIVKSGKDQNIHKLRITESYSHRAFDSEAFKNLEKKINQLAKSVEEYRIETYYASDTCVRFLEFIKLGS